MGKTKDPKTGPFLPRRGSAGEARSVSPPEGGVPAKPGPFLPPEGGVPAKPGPFLPGGGSAGEAGRGADD